jgi:hypothetical protein
LKIEAALVAGTEETLTARRQSDRAAQMRTLGGVSDHRLLRPRGLSNQPDRTDRLPRIRDPSILLLIKDREGPGNAHGQVTETGQGVVLASLGAAPEWVLKVGNFPHGQAEGKQAAQDVRTPAVEITTSGS